MPTILCFESHAADGLVWSVRHRGKWQSAKAVSWSAPGGTEYRGKLSRQPKAFMVFAGAVTVTGNQQQLRIEAQ